MYHYVHVCNSNPFTFPYYLDGDKWKNPVNLGFSFLNKREEDDRFVDELDEHEKNELDKDHEFEDDEDDLDDE